MPTESELHLLLSKFGPAIIAFLNSIHFFEIDGPYDPVELWSKVPAREKARYAKASQEKNTSVWKIVSSLLIFDSIMAGSKSTAKTYKLPDPTKPTAQAYMNAYVKSHGGEFIKAMSRTDQQKLVGFIWNNAGQNERPLARKIDQEPHLRYVLDQGNHRTETIIRTEKNRATGYGSWKFAGDNGFKTKTRHEVGDKRTRPSHRTMMGETVEIDKPYSNGENYPGEHDINCRGHQTYGLEN